MRVRLYQVAVDAPIENVLTYSHPQGIAQTIPVGSCVVVPLGRRHVIGFIFEATERGQQELSFEVKSIIDVFEPSPFLPPDLLPLYKWISSYYHYPIGRVVKAALPVAPTVRSSVTFALSSEVVPRKNEFDVFKTGQQHPPWLEQLFEKKEISSSTLTTFNQEEKK